MNNNCMLVQTVQVPTMVGGKFEYKEYDAEVGTISNVFLGFERDHNFFSFAIEIEDLYHGHGRSTGYRGLDKSSQSMALIRQIIKTVGGEYSNFSALVGKPAALMRDRDASGVPVGIASPVTGKYCLFTTDYSIEEEKVDVPF